MEQSLSDAVGLHLFDYRDVHHRCIVQASLVIQSKGPEPAIRSRKFLPSHTLLNDSFLEVVLLWGTYVCECHRELDTQRVLG